MKRKNLILTALTLVVVALGGLNLSISNKQKAAEALLANIEATAAGEGTTVNNRSSSVEPCSFYLLYDSRGVSHIASFELPNNYDELLAQGWSCHLVDSFVDTCAFEDKNSTCQSYACFDSYL